MKIHGLQKMTLLDYPGRVACTVFFGGCEMRCPFCHNAELLDGSAPSVMTDEELIAFLEKRKGLLDGVAFTGGEPLLQKDLPDLARRIRWTPTACILTGLKRCCRKAQYNTWRWTSRTIRNATP